MGCLGQQNRMDLYTVARIAIGVAEWSRAWDTLTMFEATVSSNPDRGNSRMSFSSDQVTSTVSSSEHAFPSKF